MKDAIVDPEENLGCFCKQREYIFVLIKKLDFTSTSTSFPICVQLYFVLNRPEVSRRTAFTSRRSSRSNDSGVPIITRSSFSNSFSRRRRTSSWPAWDSFCICSIFEMRILNRNWNCKVLKDRWQTLFRTFFCNFRVWIKICFRLYS